jgi:hypothetical protein
LEQADYFDPDATAHRWYEMPHHVYNDIEDECTDSDAEAALKDDEHLGCPSPGDLNNGLNRTVIN